MSLIKLSYIFVLSFAVVLILIPQISKLSLIAGILDKTDKRKLHKNHTPRLGGIAIFFAFLLSLVLFCDVTQESRGFLAGAIIIFLTGLADDVHSLTPKQKIIGQTLAALSAVLIGGISVSSLGNLFGWGEIKLGIWAIPVSVFAIVSVTNAVNLLDGMDGLVAGITVVALTAMGLLAFHTGDWQLISLAASLAGALIGFLKYNSRPASIFMGDSGSLLLGYSLGAFSIMLVMHGNGTVQAMTPVIILALPIFDTLCVIGMRLRAGVSPLTPDNNHIHHRLFALGAGYKFTVIMLYIFAYLLSVLAVLLHNLPSYQLLMLLAAAYPLIYFVCVAVARFVAVKRMKLIKEHRTYRQTSFYQRLVALSPTLKTIAKSLLFLILLLSALTPSPADKDMAVIGAILLIISVILAYRIKDNANQFLLFILYFDGAFIIFRTVNLGEMNNFFGLSLLYFSNVIFLILFVLIGLKVILRNRTSAMLNTPMDYLIFFTTMSVPMLPQEISGPYHLLTVAAKSLVLFMAYKLVLMEQVTKYHGVILGTMMALLFVACRSFVGF